MLDKKKDEVQQQALKVWKENNKCGSLEISTGIGKTFIFLHALYTMPKNDGKLHLFLAETIDRETDLKKEILLYNQIFKRDVYYDYNLEFHCYQTVYKWSGYNFGLVGLDEIHDFLSPEYSKFYFNNKMEAVIGLSAKIDLNKKYFISNQIVTKGDLLNKIAPIIFKYSLNDGLTSGLSRELNIHVIFHNLDKINKTVEAGSAKNRFFQTEFSAYNYWDSQYLLAWHEEDVAKKEQKLKMSIYRRSRLLFELPSKITTVKKILQLLDGQTLLFGNSISSLKKITPNVITSLHKNEKNQEIRSNFEKGIINLMAAFKKLKQGANLPKLDNLILMSYYSTEKDLIQMLGRLRKNEEKIGNVYIIVTKDTQEEIWFNKMMVGTEKYNKIYYNNINEFVEKNG